MWKATHRCKTPAVAFILMAAVSAIFAQSAATRVHGRILARGGSGLGGDVTVVYGGRDVRTVTYRTDSSGAFSFPVNAGPPVLLVAKADGYVSAEKEINPGATPAPLEFVLAPSGAASGQVLDGAGRPIAGASVAVYYPGERRAYLFSDEVGDVTTDEFGHFTLPAIAQDMPFIIQAWDAERLPTSGVALVLRGKTMNGVTVRLNRQGEVVRGKVIDAAGQPVASAALRLRSLATQDFSSEERQTAGVLSATMKTGTTGPDGSFEFRGIPTGKFVIVATRSGSRPTRVEGTVGSSQPAEVIIVFR